MGKTIHLIVVLLAAFVSPAAGTTWYVDGAVPESGDGQSWETALKTIQQGIDAASHGDTVLVAQGAYVENIHLLGKNITLTSTAPLDSTVLANTIIDGNQAGSVVTFSGTENETCTLCGFTIRNGKSDYGAGVCGGTWRNHGHPTIENNLITGNYAKDGGGGIAYCDGRIRDDAISYNGADYGGGLLGCDGVIEGNVISRNVATGGGGLSGCNGIIRNNQILENRAIGMTYSEGWPPQFWSVDGNGGGLKACDGTIQGNLIAGNSAEIGGIYASCAGAALYGCGGTIQNNTIRDNSTEKHGGGLYLCGGTIQNNVIHANTGEALYDCDGTIQNNTIVFNSWYALYYCDGTIRNCIIWGNGDSSGSGLYGLSKPTHCLIQNWTGGGEGNITKDPGFLDPDGPDHDLETCDDNDYHLRDGSPCIDAGLNFYWFAWPQSDLDGNCRLAADRVDIGCYEFGSSSDADGDLLSDKRESAVGTDPNREDTDGDSLRDGLEIFRGSDPLAPTAPGIIRVPSDVPAVQASLCLAVDGDEILVLPGIYHENLHFCGPEVILHSSNPDDPDVVAATILHGGEQGPVVWFMGHESEACVLRGFTIGGGRTTNGGGICGGTPDVHTHATIEDNVITENYVTGAPEPKGTGGGVAFCDGTIRNNTISANEGWLRGGGLAYCNGLISNNIITGNFSSQGGGIACCSGRIENNVVSKNSGDLRGGGLAYCHGTILDNTISQNWAEDAGGALAFCNGTIQNNKISDNSAGRPYGAVGCGGGLYACGGIIRNNSITGNQTVGWEWRRDGSGELYTIYGVGGGLYDCDGTIENNTIACNSAGLGDGGGLARCDGEINNNLITLNAAENGGGLYECGVSWDYATIRNNLITLNSAGTGGGLYMCYGTMRNDTVASNVAHYGALASCQGTIQNCIIWGNVVQEGGQLSESSSPTYSCIQEWTGAGAGNIASDPRFVNPQSGNFRVLPDSPCIDAGFNSPDLPEFDIAGMHRIMFGGKSLTVDMGAYEYYINKLELGPAAGQAALTWSSLADKTYSIFYSQDLLKWDLADDRVGSAGDMTTSWLDDGSRTGVPPLLVPCRFYRVLENQ